MSISDKILKKANDRFKQLGHTARSDLSIIDFSPVDDGKHSGRILMSHARDMSAPSAYEVEQFIAANFGNEVKPRLESMAIHEKEHCVSLVVATLTRTRPINDGDTDQMVRMHPMQYMDANTKELWNVTSDEAGRKHLVCLSEVDLSEVIEARRNYRMRGAPKLASLKTAAVAVSKGDHVMFYDNGIVAHGEVTSVGNLVTIKAVTGTVKVDPQAVLKVTQKSPSDIADTKNVLRDYFSKAYGDSDYASKLTQTTSAEEAGGKSNQ